VRLHDASGQTTAEYTAMLGLVAAVLAAAGTTVGLGTIADAVARSVRTGICIVAGDVCRASDAAAAGLAPCTVAESTRGEGLTFTVASLRFGADDSWTAARRSDGSVIITHADERRLGGKVGIGVEASPLGVNAELSGKLDYALMSGRAWEFRDAASAARFLRAEDRDDIEPTWRFGDVGAVVTGEAQAGLGPLTLTGFEATARAAAGARVGRGLTTYYVRTRVDAFAGGISLPGVDATIAGPSTGDSIVEVTRDAAGPREVAFRTVERGTRPDQVVETVARLDLRDPANRAAAEPLLALRLPWPPAVARELRTLVARSVRSGTVERAVYDVDDGSEGVELSASLGVSIGVDASETELDRRLVAAQAWTDGSRARERADCGVTTAAGWRTL
jgi:Flp pilus assembly pilin Flp